MADQIDWKTRAERAETQLNAWQSEFGTSQLTHASEAYKQAVQRAERAEKACAEMRDVLERWQYYMTPLGSSCWSETFDSKFLRKVKHALSADCGKDYVRREELDRLVTMCAEAGIGDWRGDYFLGKLTETGKLRSELAAAKAEVEMLRKIIPRVYRRDSDLKYQEIMEYLREAIGNESE